MNRPPRGVQTDGLAWGSGGGLRWVDDAIPWAFRLHRNLDTAHDPDVSVPNAPFLSDLLPPDEFLGTTWLILPRSMEHPDWEPSRVYDPTQVPGLHRLFAEVDLGREAIKSFASDYGLLGRNLRLLRTLLPTEDPMEPKESSFSDVSLAGTGEPLSTWCQQIVGMRAMLEVWDCLQDRHQLPEHRVAKFVDPEYQGTFQKHFQSESPDFYFGQPDYMWNGVTYPVWMDMSWPVNWRQVGLYWLEVMINRCLAAGCRPAVHARPGSPVRVLPNDLLGAIHLALADEVTGKAGTLIKCQAPRCGKYFHPLHGRQVYCDDRCKFKAYRDRKKEKSSG